MTWEWIFLFELGEYLDHNEFELELTLRRITNSTSV